MTVDANGNEEHISRCRCGNEAESSRPITVKDACGDAVTRFEPICRPCLNGNAPDKTRYRRNQEMGGVDGSYYRWLRGIDLG